MLPTKQTAVSSPGIRRKVILHRPAIPHRIDGIGAVRSVMTVHLLDSLLEVTYKDKGYRSRISGHTNTNSRDVPDVFRSTHPVPLLSLAAIFRTHY